MYFNDQIETYLGITDFNPVHGNDASLIEDGISQARAGLGKHFNGWSASVYARRPLSDSVNDFLKFSYGIMFSFNI